MVSGICIKEQLIRLFLWARNEYIIMLPISCLLFICESIITNRWFDFQGLETGIFIMDIIVVIILLMIWLIYNKGKIKKIIIIAETVFYINIWFNILMCFLR